MPHAHASGFPPRSQHGEGQALALRGGAPFFSPQRGSLSPAISIITIYVSPSVVCDRLITNGAS